MKKKIVLALVGLFLLAGCASSSDPVDGSNSLREETILLDNGTQVTCVIYASGNTGGLSCDWEGATR